MTEEVLPRINELRRFFRVLLSRGVVVIGVSRYHHRGLGSILWPLS